MLKVKVSKRTRLYFEIILLIQVVFTFFLQQYLYPIHFPPQFFFFLYIPMEIIVVINLFNTFFFWATAKRFLRGNLSLIPPAIYAISPWGNYLSAMGSIYILSLFMVLLVLYGLVILRSGESRIFWTKAVGLLAGISVLVAVPLVFLSEKGVYDFRKAAVKEIKIFSDPGLINNVESFQVEVGESGLGSLSKFAENRYINSVEYVFLKYVKNLTPSTFFTPQEKLLNFSFSPPIYFGFIFPFLYGLYLVLRSPVFRKRFFVGTILVTPSLLAGKMVDLNRLVIFSPVVIFVISYGLIAMFEGRKNRTLHAFLAISAFLLVVQVAITFLDIGTKEQDRYIKYFGGRFEIGQ